MSEHDEYTMQDTQFPPENIQKVVIGGRLYVDGVPVHKWQLTPEELKQYFPEDHLQEYGIGPVPCPMPVTNPVDGSVNECGFICDGTNKAAWVMHTRQKHAEWYELNREWIKQFDSTVNTFKAIKAGRDTKPA